MQPRKARPEGPKIRPCNLRQRQMRCGKERRRRGACGCRSCGLRPSRVAPPSGRRPGGQVGVVHKQTFTLLSKICSTSCMPWAAPARRGLLPNLILEVKDTFGTHQLMAQSLREQLEVLEMVHVSYHVSADCLCAPDYVTCMFICVQSTIELFYSLYNVPQASFAFPVARKRNCGRHWSHGWRTCFPRSLESRSNAAAKTIIVPAGFKLCGQCAF